MLNFDFSEELAIEAHGSQAGGVDAMTASIAKCFSTSSVVDKSGPTCLGEDKCFEGTVAAKSEVRPFGGDIDVSSLCLQMTGQ